MVTHTITQTNATEWFTPSGSQIGHTINSGDTILLAENITLTEDSFIILSNSVTFDGQGYTINMNNISFSGLFETTNTTTDLSNGCIIKDLNVINGIVNYRGGSLMRQSQQCFTIQNCTTTCELSQDQVGGLTGWNTGSDGGNVLIENCNLNVEVGSKFGGGIISNRSGYNGGTVTIQKCSNTGNITGDYAGGLVGANSGWSNNGTIIVKNSYGTGNITGDYAGGLIGYRCGYNGGVLNVENCYTTGDILGSSSGGITGSHNGQSGLVNIISCFTTGQIGGNDSGGLCGSYTAYSLGKIIIQNCYTTGQNTNPTNISSSRPGGLIGGESLTNTGKGIIQNCYTLMEAPDYNSMTLYGYGTSTPYLFIRNTYTKNAINWTYVNSVDIFIYGLTLTLDNINDESTISVPTVGDVTNTGGAYIADDVLPRKYPLLSAFNDTTNYSTTPYGTQQNADLTISTQTGCTNPLYKEYNIDAAIDDGSCETFIIRQSTVDKYFTSDGKVDENNYNLLEGKTIELLEDITITSANAFLYLPRNSRINGNGKRIIINTERVGGLFLTSGKGYDANSISNAPEIVNLGVYGTITMHVAFTGGILLQRNSRYAKFFACYVAGVNISTDGKGGFCGTLNGSSHIIIDSCFVIGEITGLRCGGFVGVHSGGKLEIKNSYTACNIQGDYSGGLIAYVENNNSVISIQNCYTTGGITKTTSGGLIGTSPDGRISTDNSTRLINTFSKKSPTGIRTNTSTVNNRIQYKPIDGIYDVENLKNLSLHNEYANILNTPSNINFTIYAGTINSSTDGNTFVIDDANTSDSIYYPLNKYYSYSNYDVVTSATLKICNNNSYIEYNPYTTSNTNCTTEKIVGCIDSTAYNYDPSANWVGECIATVYGCLDTNYLEYNESANTHDQEQCITVKVYGCTHINYYDYNEAANVDDGSCITRRPLIINDANKYDWFTTSGKPTQSILEANQIDSIEGWSFVLNDTIELETNEKLFLKLPKNTNVYGNSNVITLQTQTDGLFEVLDETESGPDSLSNAPTISKLGIKGVGLNQYGGYFCKSFTKFVKITECYSDGPINSIYSGGLIGYRSGYDNGSIYISKCYTLGDIIGYGAGGLVAAQCCSVFNDTSGSGVCIITHSYTSGNIIGDYSGGLVGALSTNGSQYNTSNTQLCIITNCYASGTLPSEINNQGGIIGYTEGSIGLFDSESSGSKNVVIINTYSQMPSNAIADYGGNLNITNLINPSLNLGVLNTNSSYTDLRTNITYMNSGQNYKLDTSEPGETTYPLLTVFTGAYYNTYTDDGYNIYGCKDPNYKEYSDLVNFAQSGACVTRWGCMDSNYDEYDATVETQKPDSCITLLGCTDPNYQEYNTEAGKDDGTCVTRWGCMDSNYDEYDADAIITKPDSCITLLGCTDPNYQEYNTEAGKDDGTCVTRMGCMDSNYDEYDAAAIITKPDSCITLLGCTDPNYQEYNAEAGKDDGSCVTRMGCMDFIFNEYDPDAVEQKEDSCLTYALLPITNENKDKWFTISGVPDQSIYDTFNRTTIENENIVLLESITLTTPNVYLTLLKNTTFDGNQKTIDLSINTTKGLFNTVTGLDKSTSPVIKNLGVLNGNLKKNAGYILQESVDFCKIENCFTTGPINGSESGGIAGKNAGSSRTYLGDGGYVEIDKCYTLGEISGYGSGGISGSYAGSNKLGVIFIKNCYTTGDIVNDTAGGLVGKEPAYDRDARFFLEGNGVSLPAGSERAQSYYVSTCIIMNSYSIGRHNIESNNGIYGITNLADTNDTFESERLYLRNVYTYLDDASLNVTNLNTEQSIILSHSTTIFETTGGSYNTYLLTENYINSGNAYEEMLPEFNYPGYRYTGFEYPKLNVPILKTFTYNAYYQAGFNLLGCTDYTYREYNILANIDDNTCINLKEEGCMIPYPTAINYNSTAEIDDGTCIIEGCADETAYNYSEKVTVDNSASCIPVIEGCTSRYFTEYDPSANTNDGSCVNNTYEYLILKQSSTLKPTSKKPYYALGKAKLIEYNYQNDDGTYEKIDFEYSNVYIDTQNNESNRDQITYPLYDTENEPNLTLSSNKADYCVLEFENSELVDTGNNKYRLYQFIPRVLIEYKYNSLLTEIREALSIGSEISDEDISEQYQQGAFYEKDSSLKRYPPLMKKIDYYTENGILKFYLYTNTISRNITNPITETIKTDTEYNNNNIFRDLTILTKEKTNSNKIELNPQESSTELFSGKILKPSSDKTSTISGLIIISAVNLTNQWIENFSTDYEDLITGSFLRVDIQYPSENPIITYYKWNAIEKYYEGNDNETVIIFDIEKNYDNTTVRQIVNSLVYQFYTIKSVKLINMKTYNETLTLSESVYVLEDVNDQSQRVINRSIYLYDSNTGTKIRNGDPNFSPLGLINTELNITSEVITNFAITNVSSLSDFTRYPYSYSYNLNNKVNTNLNIDGESILYQNEINDTCGNFVDLYVNDIEYSVYIKDDETIVNYKKAITFMITELVDTSSNSTETINTYNVYNVELLEPLLTESLSDINEILNSTTPFGDIYEINETQTSLKIKTVSTPETLNYDKLMLNIVFDKKPSIEQDGITSLSTINYEEMPEKLSLILKIQQDEKITLDSPNIPFLMQVESKEKYGENGTNNILGNILLVNDDIIGTVEITNMIKEKETIFKTIPEMGVSSYYSLGVEFGKQYKIVYHESQTILCEFTLAPSKFKYGPSETNRGTGKIYLVNNYTQEEYDALPDNIKEGREGRIVTTKEISDTNIQWASDKDELIVRITGTYPSLDTEYNVELTYTISITSTGITVTDVENNNINNSLIYINLDIEENALALVEIGSDRIPPVLTLIEQSKINPDAVNKEETTFKLYIQKTETNVIELTNMSERFKALPLFTTEINTNQETILDVINKLFKPDPSDENEQLVLEWTANKADQKSITLLNTDDISVTMSLNCKDEDHFYFISLTLGLKTKTYIELLEGYITDSEYQSLIETDAETNENGFIIEVLIGEFIIPPFILNINYDSLDIENDAVISEFLVVNNIEILSIEQDETEEAYKTRIKETLYFRSDETVNMSSTDNTLLFSDSAIDISKNNLTTFDIVFLFVNYITNEDNINNVLDILFTIYNENTVVTTDIYMSADPDKNTKISYRIRKPTEDSLNESNAIVEFILQTRENSSEAYNEQQIGFIHSKNIMMMYPLYQLGSYLISIKNTIYETNDDYNNRYTHLIPGTEQFENDILLLLSVVNVDIPSYNKLPSKGFRVNGLKSDIPVLTTNIIDHYPIHYYPFLNNTSTTVQDIGQSGETTDVVIPVFLNRLELDASPNNIIFFCSDYLRTIIGINPENKNNYPVNEIENINLVLSSNYNSEINLESKYYIENYNLNYKLFSSQQPYWFRGQHSWFVQEMLYYGVHYPLYLLPEPESKLNGDITNTTDPSSVNNRPDYLEFKLINKETLEIETLRFYINTKSNVGYKVENVLQIESESRFDSHNNIKTGIDTLKIKEFKIDSDKYELLNYTYKNMTNTNVVGVLKSTTDPLLLTESGELKNEYANKAMRYNNLYNEGNLQQYIEQGAYIYKFDIIVDSVPGYSITETTYYRPIDVDENIVTVTPETLIVTDKDVVEYGTYQSLSTTKTLAQSSITSTPIIIKGYSLTDSSKEHKYYYPLYRNPDPINGIIHEKVFIDGEGNLYGGYYTNAENINGYENLNNNIETIESFMVSHNKTQENIQPQYSDEITPSPLYIIKEDEVNILSKTYYAVTTDLKNNEDGLFTSLFKVKDEVKLEGQTSRFTSNTIEGNTLQFTKREFGKIIGQRETYYTLEGYSNTGVYVKDQDFNILEENEIFETNIGIGFTVAEIKNMELYEANTDTNTAIINNITKIVEYEKTQFDITNTNTTTSYLTVKSINALLYVLKEQGTTISAPNLFTVTFLPDYLNKKITFDLTSENIFYLMNNGFTSYYGLNRYYNDYELYTDFREYVSAGNVVNRIFIIPRIIEGRYVIEMGIEPTQSIYTGLYVKNDSFYFTVFENYANSSRNISIHVKDSDVYYVGKIELGKVRLPLSSQKLQLYYYKGLNYPVYETNEEFNETSDKFNEISHDLTQRTVETSEGIKTVYSYKLFDSFNNRKYFVDNTSFKYLLDYSNTLTTSSINISNYDNSLLDKTSTTLKIKSDVFKLRGVNISTPNQNILWNGIINELKKQDYVITINSRDYSIYTIHNQKDYYLIIKDDTISHYIIGPISNIELESTTTNGDITRTEIRSINTSQIITNETIQKVYQDASIVGDSEIILTKIYHGENLYYTNKIPHQIYGTLYDENDNIILENRIFYPVYDDEEESSITNKLIIKYKTQTNEEISKIVYYPYDENMYLGSYEGAHRYGTRILHKTLPLYEGNIDLIKYYVYGYSEELDAFGYFYNLYDYDYIEENYNGLIVTNTVITLINDKRESVKFLKLYEEENIAYDSPPSDPEVLLFTGFRDRPVYQYFGIGEDLQDILRFNITETYGYFYPLVEDNTELEDITTEINIRIMGPENTLVNKKMYMLIDDTYHTGDLNSDLITTKKIEKYNESLDLNEVLSISNINENEELDVLNRISDIAFSEKRQFYRNLSKMRIEYYYNKLHSQDYTIMLELLIAFASELPALINNKLINATLLQLAKYFKEEDLIKLNINNTYIKTTLNDINESQQFSITYDINNIILKVVESETQYNITSILADDNKICIVVNPDATETFINIELNQVRVKLDINTMLYTLQYLE
jgi:hypothetical protein